MPKLVYPSLHSSDFVELMHGHSIADPYKSLENADSESTRTFVKEQNALTESILSQSNIRQKFKSRLETLMDYKKFGVPRKEGNAYYYFYNSGLQPQSVLMKQDSLDSTPAIFFDPNELSADGTISLSSYSFSESGDYFAYSLSKSGSDWFVMIRLKLI
jgi:prolyl oligopeptidase